jgi:N-acetylglucosaminyldiphosphoundecaprenol N-acetyl-beta-D-mannosaminyltransferase
MRSAEADSSDLAPKPRKRAAVIGPLASRRILGQRVDVTHYARATEAILALAEARAGGMACASTVHMVMEGHDDPEFRRLVNAADLITSDGMPLVWMLRALGASGATRVYGPDLTPIVCEAAAERGIPVGFYGSTEDVLDGLASALIARTPRLSIGFRWSPPFGACSQAEDERVVEAIQDSGIGVLFVGLGCPKQERWMAAHRDRLDCALVGVGAAFDFVAGHKPSAPVWIQRAGLEWGFRLACEPKRLWRRYLRHNPRFAMLALAQLWRELVSS